MNYDVVLNSSIDNNKLHPDVAHMHQRFMYMLFVCMYDVCMYISTGVNPNISEHGYTSSFQHLLSWDIR